jgi:hypothetical protein
MVDGRGQGGEVINWWEKEEGQTWTAGYIPYTNRLVVVETRTTPLVLGSTNLYLVLFLMQPLLIIAYQNSICLCDNRGRGQERR